MTCETARIIEITNGKQALCIAEQARSNGEFVQTFIHRELEVTMPLPFSGIDESLRGVTRWREARRWQGYIDANLEAGEKLLMVVAPQPRESQSS